MQEATAGLVDAVLRSDRTVDGVERRRLVGLLLEKPAEGGQATPDRLLRRREAAGLLGRSTKTVDRLASAGVLRRVKFPGYQRGAGFRLSDVERLISEGKGE